MDGRIDRRGFLAGAGAAGLTLAVEGVRAAAASDGAESSAIPGAARPAIARTASRRAGPPIHGQVIKRGAPGFLAAAQHGLEILGPPGIPA